MAVLGAQAPLPRGRNDTAVGAANLLVQIGAGVATRTITVPAPADLAMTWEAPGGDTSCSFTVPALGRLSGRPDALRKAMPLRVVDRRTGSIVWAGRVADPGLNGNGRSTGYRVSGAGTRADLDAAQGVKLYVDRDLSRMTWDGDFQQGQMNTGTGSGFTSNPLDSGDTTPSGHLELPIPDNSILRQNAANTMTNLVNRAANPTPASSRPFIDGIFFSWTGSTLSAGLEIRVIVANDPTVLNERILTKTWVTTQTNEALVYGSGSWTLNEVRMASIRYVRTGTTLTATADGGLRVANLAFVGRRYNRIGVFIQLTAATATVIRTHDLVEDVLGTLLAGLVKPGNVVPGGNLVQQAAWYDGVSAREILDFCSSTDATHWWAVWAPNDADGRPRLDWQRWGTDPRYTLPPHMPVELAGGGEDLADTALILYTRQDGTLTSTNASISLPELTRTYKGARRVMTLDVTSEGPLTAAVAVARGQAALAAQAQLKFSGTATVTGPLVDRRTGRTVQPWEVRPGCLVRTSVAPQAFSGLEGQVTGTDGEATFRLTGVSYSASSNSASLQLDGGARSLFRTNRVSRFKRAAGKGRPTGVRRM